METASVRNIFSENITKVLCFFHSPVDSLLDMRAGRANWWRARLSRATLRLVSVTVGTLGALRTVEDALLLPDLLSLFARISPAISSQCIGSSNQLRKSSRGPQGTPLVSLCGKSKVVLSSSVTRANVFRTITQPNKKTRALMESFPPFKCWPQTFFLSSL